MCVEIRWTTHAGDIAGVTVYSPTVDLPDRIRLTIGHDLHLYLPPNEARCVAMALLDAAAEPPPRPPVINLVPPPPRGLYHDPDDPEAT